MNKKKIAASFKLTRAGAASLASIVLFLKIYHKLSLENHHRHPCYDC